jgi:hypothetical protein
MAKSWGFKRNALAGGVLALRSHPRSRSGSSPVTSTASGQPEGAARGTATRHRRKNGDGSRHHACSFGVRVPWQMAETRAQYSAGALAEGSVDLEALGPLAPHAPLQPDGDPELVVEVAAAACDDKGGIPGQGIWRRVFGLTVEPTDAESGVK